MLLLLLLLRLCSPFMDDKQAMLDLPLPGVVGHRLLVALPRPHDMGLPVPPCPVGVLSVRPGDPGQVRGGSDYSCVRHLLGWQAA